ncbi:alpha/beta hydrolase [Streptomyces sp. J2-1]|uniref:alpha/beta fold hydrolase n=1 Tax=Streptomyces corallincola TaxID=2851888 RepID=UPI001C384DB8|nr:alpha/beta hydrolase [Streptomyces corallincola]MBV2353926.1 alpha/beta hydrolase [Streptomyces corallincola]
MNPLPSLLLVHGAWHAPWCWEQLAAELPDVDVRTVALPSSGSDPKALGDLYDDAAAISGAVREIGGPTVVVGHSYGGCPVTQAAGSAGDVRRVVYLSALMQDVGDSLLSLVGGAYPPDWDVHEETECFGVHDPLHALYADVEPELAARSAARLGYESLRAVRQPLTEAAWHTVPSTYIVCEEDVAIPPVLQEQMAVRADRVRRIRSSHSPFLSRPAELAALLREEMTV